MTPIHPRTTLLYSLLALGVAASSCHAGDILRGGATRASDATRARDLAAVGQAQALRQRAESAERMARATRSLQQLQAAQAAARAAARAADQPGINPITGAPLPYVPDGLGPGGLDLDHVVRGANNPVQTGNLVTVKQTAQQALLHWRTFNVGRNTTLDFDQSAGGADAGKWIAFNKVTGADVAPSQILGSITAQGQVYVLNQNGVIFGGGSQVNARALVASSLPLNDNLLAQGLLNNRDAQFLFSTITVPGGSAGTPAFVPPPPPPGGRHGDVIVQRGAQIRTTLSEDGGGGRVMLAAPNVRNEGIIETPNGQAILAAGNQVGMVAHPSDDPSLRGLDIWIGRVEDYAGAVVNTGIIRSLTGSITLAGRRISQSGGLETSTSVALNGRIDLLASYGAAANPGYEGGAQAGAAAPPFFNQFTGTVEFTPGSVTRILPQIDGKKIPGTKLPERSRVEIEGLAAHFGPGSIIMAPGGTVNIRAGTWPYRDLGNNGTVLDGDGNLEPNLVSYYTGGRQIFLHDRGQVYFDPGSLLDVSGTTTAFVPLGDSVVEVTMRGNELADSPLLRDSALRGLDLSVDLRRDGSYFGRYWIGTPLGDLTGILNVIERDILQLTSAGGDIRIRAGESIVVRSGATLDVSGGVLQHQGGRVQTTRLLGGARLFDMHNATPDMRYDSIYDGRTTSVSTKWGVTQTYFNALAPLGGFNDQPHLSGAPGGTLDLTAPAMILDGSLLGRTVTGPRQLGSPGGLAALSLTFLSQKRVDVGAAPFFINHSPTPPAIRITPGTAGSAAGVPEFVLSGGEPLPLPPAVKQSLVLGSSLLGEEDGFGKLAIDNREGTVTVNGPAPLRLQPGGGLRVDAANIFLNTGISAPGGSITFTANNYSPFLLNELNLLGLWGNGPAPDPLPDRGEVSLSRSAWINTAGRLVDFRPLTSASPLRQYSIDGGTIRLEGYSILLPSGSHLDASAGLQVNALGQALAGHAGDIAILAGRDPVLDTSIGGRLQLEAGLRAAGFVDGGSLTVRANLIRIGGGTVPDGGLGLSPEFFRTGGFASYRLIGIGGRDGTGQALPGLEVAPGTLIAPVTETLRAYFLPQLSSSPLLQQAGLRPPASIALEAVGADDSFTTSVIEAVGLVTLGRGSHIVTDPLGKVSVSGAVVLAYGSISAPAGQITLRGGSSHPVAPDLAASQTLALPTVYLGPGATLSAAGASILLPDRFGRRAGVLYSGGSVSLNGNILTERGSVIDVAGSSAVLDFHPSRLGLATPYATAGLTTTPYARQAVAVRVDSDGGSIRLTGSQMLYNDATLRGGAGGPAALGGTLSVGSGLFRPGPRNSAEINLIVDQTGSAAAFGNTGVYGDMAQAARFLGTGTDLAALFAAGSSNPGIGYFALSQFSSGKFGSLDLGFDFYAGAQPIAFGGNVQFRGDIRIDAPGFVRLAGGGVLQADGRVVINAPYVAIGQEFRAPRDPSQRFQPFSQFSPAGGGSEYYLPPTAGSGNLSVNARLIDMGTLSLQGIGESLFAAEGGDIRGNGTVNTAGSLTLRAAQIYPTTLAAFDIFTYDAPGAPGLVSVQASGRVAAPLSAGGSLRIFAPTIRQSGTLRAPLGSIVLGWDGTDIDPSTPALDGPANAVGGIAAPVAGNVTLAAGSTTSVSADGLTIPFGLSPDGLVWIDPRGVNITLEGLPTRGVTLAGNAVDTEPGSLVDLRGGGDLRAYRWLPGIGGSIDLLGTSSSPWGAGGSYAAGALVDYKGRTYSARVTIDPANFASAPDPEDARYWTPLPDSYAIIPGFGSPFAPFAPFNTSGAGSSLLGGDPGYTAGALHLGQQIYLDGGAGLPEGTYTLLPRRYALLPGAFLVNPLSGFMMQNPVATSSVKPSYLGNGPTSVTREDGSALAIGYTFNGLHRSAPTPLRRVFEILPPAVLADRAEYDSYSANTFMQQAAARQNAATIQRLPRDAAPAVFSGRSALSLSGMVFGAGSGPGRGAEIDVASFADMVVSGAGGAAPPPGAVVLDTSVLTSWSAGSLVLGGVRTATPDGIRLDPRTRSFVLDDPARALTGRDITLLAREDLVLSAGSSLLAAGSGTSDSYIIRGDAPVARVSTDPAAIVKRSDLAGSTASSLSVGNGATVAGAGVTLDSTYAMNLDAGLRLDAGTLNLAAGQISLLLEPQGVLPGGLVPRPLVLDVALAAQIRLADTLNLLSYTSFDIHGDGTFGVVGSLSISAGAIRGFSQDGPGVVLRARDVSLANTANVSLPLGGPADTGSLTVEAERNVLLGANALTLQGFSSPNLVAGQALVTAASGSLATGGALTLTTPQVLAADSAKYSITAGGAVTLVGNGTPAAATPGLGASFTLQGSSISAGNQILMPGGEVSLQATGAGGLTVTGSVLVDGRDAKFFDLTRYGTAGRINLRADSGDVFLLAGSRLTASGAAGGGDAGTISVSTPQGTFLSSGLLEAKAGSSAARAGSFLLDAANLPSYADLRDDLASGGFAESQNLRLRAASSILLDGTTKARDFSLSSDTGDILVTGKIDASGATGGSISLASGGNLTLASSAQLTVAATEFSSAGKGGSVALAAGSAVNGTANTAALLTMDSGSQIDLSVAGFVPGDYTTPGSSAFLGQFEGTLHLRAPQAAGDVRVATIGSTIRGGSSLLVEAFRVYNVPTGVMNTALRNQINADGIAFLGAAGAPNAAETSMRNRLLGSHPQAADLAPLLVLAPGAEIVNTSGNLVLGLANPTGSTATAIRNEGFTAADWDLSSFRYGSRSAPGVLTLRAKDDLVFNNALSDGFTPVTANSDNGWSRLWLAPLMTVNPNLPVNTQSWSFRLAAGADLSAADPRTVRPLSDLGGRGSVLVGEYYPAILNNFTTGTAAGLGPNGQTADHIRFVNTASDTTERGTRFEVIRTGTGDISVHAGLDIQLRNQFATIYSAGVALPAPTQVFAPDDFVLPIVDLTDARHPSQGILGANQQRYAPRWSMAGGDIDLTAGRSILRTTLRDGQVIIDTSRQLPGNWLYRRGFVDPATGRFSTAGGVDGGSGATTLIDTAPSTAWWVDFSNFFQGIGALAGGNIAMTAGSDIINVDAVVPTTARMAGRDPATGQNLAPSAANLVEHGGGDLRVEAGRDISGGVYYVERGRGKLVAGGEIKSNEARSPSLYILGGTGEPPSVVQSVNPAVWDPLTWLPTTLFVGRSGFDVTARGNVLLGPVLSAFLTPQGLNNKFWYKTYFHTFGEEASVDVTSLGGSVTHRFVASNPGGGTEPVLSLWLRTQNLFAGVGSANNASHFQPWLRLTELDVAPFATALTVAPPILRSTAFAGDINLAGSLSLHPSRRGTIELAASGSILGLQPVGRALTPSEVQSPPVPATIWTSARLNLSDAPPSSLPGLTAPAAYSALSSVGRNLNASRSSFSSALTGLDAAFAETGSYAGANGSISVQNTLHDSSVLHRDSRDPLRTYAVGGDISGFTLFSAKVSRIAAGRDISDIAFYLQNTSAQDATIVTAGRNLIPNNAGEARRIAANSLARGNFVATSDAVTLVDRTSVNSLRGDIQIAGPGVLEVLAGGTIDLGTGANLSDGTGVGITSIGALRNPFLAPTGAGLVVLTGMRAPGGGPALGLAGSTLNLSAFIPAGLPPGTSPELAAVAGLDAFFELLKTVGQAAATSGSYDEGYAAVAGVFGAVARPGEIFTRSRDIRTVRGGGIRLGVPGGGIAMASTITGNPLAPPGIVTEYGGTLSIFTDGNVDIGRARIFSLRGGDITIWSSTGDIAAGSAPKTVVTAPPTRVVVDATSAEVLTDLGGLATGGGIGSLQLRATDAPSDVVLIAPQGTVDAGDAGIRATGNIAVAAAQVLNADNISAGGTSAGVPAPAPVAAPNVAGLSSASSSTAATSSAAQDVARQSEPQATELAEAPSVFTVEVLGYGGSEAPEEPREEENASAGAAGQAPEAQTSAPAGRVPPRA